MPPFLAVKLPPSIICKPERSGVEPSAVRMPAVNEIIWLVGKVLLPSTVASTPTIESSFGATIVPPLNAFNRPMNPVGSLNSVRLLRLMTLSGSVALKSIEPLSALGTLLNSIVPPFLAGTIR